MAYRNGSDTGLQSYCQDHSEHKAMITRNADDIKELKIAMEKHQENQDRTAKVIVGGAFSIFLVLLGMVGQYVMHFKAKPVEPQSIIVISQEELKAKSKMAIKQLLGKER